MKLWYCSDGDSLGNCTTPVCPGHDLCELALDGQCDAPATNAPNGIALCDGHLGEYYRLEYVKTFGGK